MAKFGVKKEETNIVELAESKEAELVAVIAEIAGLETRKEKLRKEVFFPAVEKSGGEWTGSYFKMTLQNGRVKEDSIVYPADLEAKLCKYKALGASLDVERKASQAYKDAVAAAPKMLVCKVLKD